MATRADRVAGELPEHGAGAASASLAPFDRRVLVVAGGVLALLVGLSGLYGFHRDELYFLDCGRHLSASYVDQPVLTPLLARLSLSLFGVSLVGLRLWAALAAAATTVLGGLLAREFGGGRQAQLLAALGVGTAPVVLGNGHLFGPTVFDLLTWAGLAFFVVRIGRTGDTRLWVPAGVILGIGLANKHSIGFFAVAIVIGTVASGGGRRFLGNRWFVIGVTVAALFVLPDLWWQATHHWASVAMTRRLAQENGGLGNAIKFIPAPLVLVTPFLIWMWIAGLGVLWRSGNPLWRSLAWSFGLLFVFFAATAGAKPYYLGGTCPYLLGAGAVWAERWVARGPARLSKVLVGTGVSLLATLPFVLPVLPARDIGFVYGLNSAPAETVGWPQLVGTVAHVWRTLPQHERATGVIYTADYGEAGAINELGRSSGLPEAVSGHNTLWWWGPGDARATTVVAVAPGPMDVTNFGHYLRGMFAHVRVAATLGNPAHLHNQEYGGHVYVCTGPDKPWGQLWARLRHYD